MATSMVSKLFNSLKAFSITAVSPDAGPLTLNSEPLKAPTTIPPMMPEIKPLRGLAPDATAIPKHKGTATKKTTMEADKSDLMFIMRNGDVSSKQYYGAISSHTLKDHTIFSQNSND
jgi:hypothetical protein